MGKLSARLQVTTIVPHLYCGKMLSSKAHLVVFRRTASIFMSIKTFESLGGTTWKILRLPEEHDVRWSAFNPSISYSPEAGYVVLFRSSNYFLDPKTTDAKITLGSTVKSRMWLGDLDDNWQIHNLREIDFSEAGLVFTRGAEDGRLYWHEGAWELTAGLKEPEVPLPRIGRFRLEGLKAKLIEIYQGTDLYDVEKNWMAPVIRSDKFDYIYNPISIYKNGVGPIKVREPSELVRHVRGGSQLWPVENGYLAIIHEAIVKHVYMYIPRYFGYKNVKVRHYVHRFAKYDLNGTLVALTDRFKLSDARIEFAAGLVIHEDDVIVSYGYKDVASYLGKIKLSAVLSMMKEV